MGDDDRKIEEYLARHRHLEALQRQVVPPKKLIVAARKLRGLSHDLARRFTARRPRNTRPDKAWLDSLPPTEGNPRILIDITDTHRIGLETGIQRVVRKIGEAAARSGAALPVYIEDGRLYPGYAPVGDRKPIEVRKGDRFVLLDSGWIFADEYRPILDRVSAADGLIVACLYDLIPIRYPGAYGGQRPRSFVEWIDNVVLGADAVVAISRSVADDLLAYAEETGAVLKPGFSVGWWRLGADSVAGAPLTPTRHVQKIAAAGSPFFISVGTLEPRKCHSFAIDAFEQLWQRDVAANYVIVGRKGWHVDALIRRIEEHPAYRKRLFWVSDAGDADLHFLYANARGVIAPSFVEGFGLPIAEAMDRGVPVIASDIPVFREVGGDAIDYFRVLDRDDLAAKIRARLAIERRPPAVQMASWAESAAELIRIVRDDAYQYGCVTGAMTRERRGAAS